MVAVEELARWVILQCLADAGIRDRGGHVGWDVSGTVKSEAISFLTASTGEWRRSREFWCYICDRDPNDLREWAVRKLGPQPVTSAVQTSAPPRAPKPGTKLAALVASLRSEGITLDEMMVRFGWSRVTCSTAICGDLPAKFGFRSKRGPDGRYRMIEAA